LIVEDSSNVRRTLGALISDIEGLALAGCADDVPKGRDALNKLQPEVVILDIHLPGGSGLDILKTLQTSETKPQKVIVFSSVDSAYKRTCLDLGADFFFDKPLELGMLEELLRKVAIESN